MNEKIDQIFRSVMEWEDDAVVEDSMSSDTVEEWDSLVSMELTLKLEKIFSVKFNFDEIVNMESIGDIKRILQQKLQNKSN